MIFLTVPAGLAVNLPVTAEGLAGVKLLSVDGPALSFATSPDNVNFTSQTLPLTLQAGTYLRITHNAVGTDSSVINAEPETTLAVDANGRLIETNRNGTTRDLGLVRGADGAAGTNGTNGTNGQGFSFRQAWQPNTVYAPYDVVTNSGSAYVAVTNFTSGAAFNPGNWIMLAQKGADGSGGSTTLAGLTDTSINAPGSLQAILYSGGKWANVTLSLLAGHLADVAIAAPAAGHVLTYSTGSSKWVNRALKISDLGDVNLAGLANGNVLVYDSASSTWKPGTVSGGSGGGVSGPASSNAFGLTMFSNATGQVLADSLITTTATGGLRMLALASGSTVGSARGSGAIDLQAYRSNAANVASGQFSVLISYDGRTSADYAAVIGGKSGSATATCSGVVAGTSGTASGSYAVVLGGFGNTASNDSSIAAGGRYNQANGMNSATIGGTQANARRYGQFSRTNQGISNGEMQWSHLTLGWRSAAALNNQELTLDNAAPVNGTGNTANRFWLTQGMMVTFRGIVQATTSNSQYEGASWEFRGTAMCNAAGVTVSGVTITPVGNFAPGASTAATWSVAIQGAALASGAGYLQFLVTNGAPLSGSVRWLASIDFVEII